MENITSRANPLCVHFRKLASARSYREDHGEYLCDSPKLLREAVQWGAEVTAVLYTRGADLPECPGARLAEVSESVMKSVSPMETPQGVVFSCRLQDRGLPETLDPKGRYVLLDGVQDPGNVGTILRTADAFGWTPILLTGCADLCNPKTLRAAMGVHFRRAVWQASLEEVRTRMQTAGLPLYAAALREDTEDIRTADLRHCGVVIGSEGRGISPEALALCRKTLKIPMDPRCESLNAAAAAAVILWEGRRQSGE